MVRTESNIIILFDFLSKEISNLAQDKANLFLT